MSDFVCPPGCIKWGAIENVSPALADPRDAPPRPKIPLFRAVFSKSLPSNRLAPLWGWRPGLLNLVFTTACGLCYPWFVLPELNVACSLCYLYLALPVFTCTSRYLYLPVVYGPCG